MCWACLEAAAFGIWQLTQQLANQVYLPPPALPHMSCTQWTYQHVHFMQMHAAVHRKAAQQSHVSHREA